jgi:formyl-CoA transferase
MPHRIAADGMSTAAASTATDAGIQGALASLRVIDLTRVLGGPFCTQILADHGADVVKVEPPSGDEVREWGPPFHGDDASYFVGVNRNKRSLGLDLSVARGREVLLALLRDADVLIENFKPGTLERWGLGVDVLTARFPRLIHCRISGFGADGPRGGMPGYDAIIQAMSGMMAVNGTRESGPLRIAVPLVDIATGLYAAIGILMAVAARANTGRGQFVETTLFDAGLAIMHPHAANYFLSGKRPAPNSNGHPNISPYQTYRAADGDVFIGVGNDRSFQRLCAELGRPELATDLRFARNRDRLEHRDALRVELEALLSSQKAGPLCDRLLAAGLPAGPIYAIDQALDDAHAIHRGSVVAQDWYRGIASPVRLERNPSAVRLLPPGLSANAVQILAEAGFADDAIAALMADGIVVPPRPAS